MSCEFCVDADGIPCFPLAESTGQHVHSTYLCRHCGSLGPDGQLSQLRSNLRLASPEVGDSSLHHSLVNP